MDIISERRELTGTEKALLKFYQNSQYFDVKLDVQCGQSWKSYPAHKIVLSLWSPYFENLLYRSTKEVHQKEEVDETEVVDEIEEVDQTSNVSLVEIADVPPSIISAILTFMYGCSSEIYKNENNLKFVLDVYKAAGKYQIVELKKLCCKILKFATPDKDNVFDLLNAAIFTELDTLKSRCFNILQTKTAEVLASQDLNNVTPFMMTTLLNLKTLSLSSEYDLHSYVFEWAEREYNKLSHQASDSRSEIIQPFLPYLKFASLKAEQFQMLVQKHRDFFNDREGFSIFMNILGPGSEPLPEWYNESGISRSFKMLVESDLLNPSEEDHLNSSILSHTTSTNHNAAEGEPVCHSNQDQSAKLPNHCGEDSTSDSTSATSVSHNATVGEPVCESNQDQSEKLPNHCEEDSTSDSTSATSASHNATVGEPVCDSNKDFDGISACVDVIREGMDAFSQLSLDAYIRKHGCHSLNDTDFSIPLDNSEMGSRLDTDSDCSWVSLEEPVKCRKKIRKRKIKKLYLLPGGKSLPNTHSWKSQDPLTSGDFDSLISTVWRQQRHRDITA